MVHQDFTKMVNFTKIRKMKATIVFFPNKTKKSAKTGRIPIYIRVCFCKSKSEARLNVEITESEYALWDPVAMRLIGSNLAIKHYLSRLHLLPGKPQLFVAFSPLPIPKVVNINSIVTVLIQFVPVRKQRYWS